MSESGWKATPAASDIEVASVARLQGYLAVLDAILEGYRQAQREGDMGSRARDEALLADCRKRFCDRLQQMDQTPPTPWERGVADLLEVLWDLLNPGPQVSDTERSGRVQKAQVMARTLKKLLASFIVLESFSPAEVEEALERCYEEDGPLPF